MWSFAATSFLAFIAVGVVQAVEQQMKENQRITNWLNATGGFSGLVLIANMVCFFT